MGPAARIKGPSKAGRLRQIGEREDPLGRPRQVPHGGDPPPQDGDRIGELDVDVAVGGRRHQESVDRDLLVGRRRVVADGSRVHDRPVVADDLAVIDDVPGA